MSQIPEVDAGAPVKDEVRRITDQMLETLGECDLESALTALCGVAGHCVAHLSGGKPSAVIAHSESIAANVKTAALAKLLHDDEQRRADAG